MWQYYDYCKSIVFKIWTASNTTNTTATNDSESVIYLRVYSMPFEKQSNLDLFFSDWNIDDIRT